VRSHQRLLRDILGVFAAAEHASRKAETRRRVPIDERRERTGVAGESGANAHPIGHLRQVIPANRPARHMRQLTTSNPTVPLKSSSVVARPGGATQRSPFTRMLRRCVPGASVSVVSHKPGWDS
jgi:hypothetical protein